jgi:hypothetical protein
MATSEDRQARNQTIFRAGNEAVRRNLDGAGDPIGYMCECGDDACLAEVPLERAEYESVRAHPRRFFVEVGHEARAGDLRFRVVETNGRYSVLEKTAGAGEIAEEAYPRQRDGGAPEP